MSGRKSLSKRARFEVFKRDQFTCQYCGVAPPQAILHVDHITPVAEGGGNEIGNLITACQSCNLGKGAVPLTSVPMSLGSRGAELKEREEQLKGYQEIVAARSERLDGETWDVVDELEPANDGKFDRRNWNSVRHFVEQLGVHDVIEAARLAHSKVRGSEYQRFRYFCGICWNKIRRAADAG